MNPLIKTQLEKIKTVKLPSFDENTTEMIITADSKIEELFLEEDKCYLISVEDYILYPPDGFTLHTNWNNGKVPTHKFMKIDVSKIMGKMVKVNAIGYDMKSHTDTMDLWDGWLPMKSITILEVL
jgi:hypothetical protein